MTRALREGQDWGSLASVDPDQLDWSSFGRQKKRVVEDCYLLDVYQWNRNGKLKPNSFFSGDLIWSYTLGFQASMGYEVSTRDMNNPFIRLYYEWKNQETDETHSENYRIPLAITRPTLGGLRWWFICPLFVNNRPCKRRVARLYIPGGRPLFGCRHCYKLTYTSSQENHVREAFWRKAAEGKGFHWRRFMKYVIPKRTEILPDFR
jgi:hypothetical protein